MSHKRIVIGIFWSTLQSEMSSWHTIQKCDYFCVFHLMHFANKSWPQLFLTKRVTSTTTSNKLHEFPFKTIMNFLCFVLRFPNSPQHTSSTGYLPKHPTHYTSYIDMNPVEPIICCTDTTERGKRGC